MKYAGPRYVLVNHTNSCYKDVDSAWVDHGVVEGHPRLEDRNQNKLSTQNDVFHVDQSTEKFTPSEDDIQVKRLNGFYRIYCYGHSIVVRNVNVTCPPYVFKIPQTDRFTLNGHTYQANSHKQVSISLHELEIDRQLAKQLKFYEVKIKPANLSAIDQHLGHLNNLFKSVGMNVTIDSMDWASFTGPLGSVFSYLRSTWGVVEDFVIIALFEVAAIVLIEISLIVNIVALICKGGVGLFRSSQSRNKHSHYV